MPEQPPTVRTRVPPWTGAPELGPVGVAVAWLVVAAAWGAFALARDGGARALLAAGSPWTWISLVVLGGGLAATGAARAALARRTDRARFLVVAPAVLALVVAVAAASSLAPSAPSAPEGAAAIARGAAAAARARREADAFGAGALGLAAVALLLGCASTALSTRAMKRAVARRLAAEAWLALSLGLLVALVSAPVAALALSADGGTSGALAASGVRGVALVLGLVLTAGGVLGAVAAATALAGSAESRDDHVGALGDLFGALALALASIVAATGAAKARLAAAAFASAADATTVAASVDALSTGGAGAVAARWAGLMFALPLIVAAVAVIAPRRALVASAVRDGWAVPVSAFVVAVATWVAAGARLAPAAASLVDAEGARFPAGLDPVALPDDALASASAPDEASVIVVRRDDAAAATDPAACAAKLDEVDRRRKDRSAPRAYDVLVDERAPAAVLACFAAAARDRDATFRLVVRAPEVREGEVVVRDVAVALPVRVAGKGGAGDAVARVHVTATGATLERAEVAPVAAAAPAVGVAAASKAPKAPKEETRTGTGRELASWVRDLVPLGTVVVSADADALASSVLPLLAPRAAKGGDAVFAARRDDAEPGGASASAPAPPPAVLASVTASGGLKQEAADKAVREHVTAFARCGPTEAVSLEATVGARGAVARTVKLGATKQDRVTVACLLRALSAVKFPASHRHAKVVVAFAKAAP